MTMRSLAAKTAVAALLMTLLAACGPKIYLANDFRAYAPRHKTLAILPADVTVQLRPNEARHTTAEQQQAQERRMSTDFQEKIYYWLLVRNYERGFTVRFQDVRLTNARLRKSNLNAEDLRARSPQELARVLGVDAVLTTSVRTSRTMNDGAAVAMAAFVGAYGATNKANISVSILEGGEGKLLWKYDYVAAGTMFDSSDNIVNALMRIASKRFPYTLAAR